MIDNASVLMSAKREWHNVVIAVKVTLMQAADISSINRYEKLDYKSREIADELIKYSKNYLSLALVILLKSRVKKVYLVHEII